MASVLNCPIAVEPTSSGVLISTAGGSVLGTSPGTIGSAFQPKRSEASTRASAPSSTPSGANTELHEWAKLLRKLPPQNSPPAFSSSTPSMIAALSTGNSVLGLTMPASSAAVAVTILKVEPGGWGAEKAIPARARISPLRASSAAIPPKRPARATTAASCRRVSIVVCTGRA